MTGFEIVPAAASAAKAVAAAVGEDMVAETASVKDALGELSRQAPDMAKAAEVQARRVLIKQAIRLKVVERVGEWFGVSQDYLNNHFADDLADKMSAVPEENIVTPILAIAAPAIQGLSYSFDEPDLKEMYLNLLATASDDRVRGNAHPAFSEIIKQLSATEAAPLLAALGKNHLPLVRVETKPNPEGGFRILQNHILDFHDDHERAELAELPIYVDNWVRLGLITASYTDWLTAPRGYDWKEQRPEVLRLQTEHGSDNLVLRNGLIRTTDFGLRFKAAVSTPPEPSDSPTPEGPA